MVTGGVRDLGAHRLLLDVDIVVGVEAGRGVMGVELCGAVLSLHAAHIRETVQTPPCTWGSPVLYVLSPGAGEAMSVLCDNLSATESQEPGPSPGAIGRSVGRPRAPIGCRPGLLTDLGR